MGDLKDKNLRGLFVANWKMNQDPLGARAYIRYMLKALPKQEQAQFVFLAPALLLPILQQELAGSGFNYGAQNCHFEEKGPWTGENSPLLLKQMGATHCLVGHSERRRFFFEDNPIVIKKVRALHKLSLEPIICVGELATEYKKGETLTVIQQQISPLLELSAKSFCMAYEPVWAIGTGQVAPLEHINQVRELIQKMFKAKDKKLTFLYGGSVQPKNIQSLAKIPGVNGFLVGGAGLKAESFVQLYRCAGIKLSKKGA